MANTKDYAFREMIYDQSNCQVSKDGFPFNGHARCKDVVRELYHGLLEMVNAYPKEYVDGCPFTQDVVRRALKSEMIEKYLLD